MFAQILLVFEKWRFLRFFSKKSFDKNEVTEMEFFNPVVACCQGTLRGLPIWRSSITAQILLIFEIWLFYDVFNFFKKKKLGCEIKKELEFLTLLWRSISLKSGVTNMASKYECSNFFGFKDMAFFLNFKFFFIKKTYIKNINRTSQPYSGVLSD